MIFPASLSQSKRIGKPTQFPVMPVGGAAAFVGALDGVPNLVHLYDIARRWLTSYEGRLARFRRSSDHVEADFSYDADGNLDVAAIAAWAGGSAFITVIADQVGSDDVSQATAGNQPLYVASGQNGRPVGRYNGTSQFLQGAFTSGGQLSQPYNYYAVVKSNQTTSIKIFIAGIVASGANRLLLGLQPSWIAFAGLSLLGGAANTNWNVWSVFFNGASSQYWHNGTSKATGNAGTNNASGITIGDEVGNGWWWNGDIGTIAIADPNHDTADREIVEAAVGDYYAIP